MSLFKVQSKRKGKRPQMCRQSVFSAKKIIFHRNDEWIGSGKAAEIAGVSRKTVAVWCAKYGIGKQVGRNYKIDPIKLKQVMEKDTRPFMTRDLKTGKGVRSYKCPYGYKFGIDYDEQQKCEKCNQIVWLHCGRKNEKIYMAEQALLRSEKLYTKSELKRKIKEMEERL